MRQLRLAGVAAALGLASVTVAHATDGSIGVYADAAATITHASLSLGQPTTLYVVAQLEGATVSGATGFEFRIDGFPADWFASLTPNPAAALVLGDPLHTTGGIHRANIAFAGCQRGDQGKVLLYTIFLVPFSSTGQGTLRVEAGDPPSNLNFTSPTILLCDFPDFTPVGATGLPFTIDAVRQPQGLDYSLAPGYDGYRGVQPIAGLPGNTFRFRAGYSQIDGESLPPGQPVLQLDGNDDGDSNDPGEGIHPLVPADHDSTTIDGKDYLVDVALAAAPTGRWHYRFIATDAHGQPAAGPATVWNDSLFVAPELVDLLVQPEDMIATGGSMNPADPLSLEIQLTNASDTALHDVVVRVEEEGDLLAERTFPHLAPRATGLLAFDWSFAQAGLHVLTARLDPSNAIDERDETNNVATRSVMVSQAGVTGDIDLQVFPVSFQDPPLKPFRVTGLAHYTGVAVGTSPPVVGARIIWAPSWEAPSESRTRALGAFAHEFIAPAAAGLYTLGVTVTDGTRTHSATVPVQVVAPSGDVHGPDLVPELTLAPVSACPGSALSARWSVRNAGDRSAGATTVQLEMDGVQIILERPIGPLSPGASIALADADLGIATAGAHWVTARVDPHNAIAELREDDGARTVQRRVPGAGPDLGVDALSFQVPLCVGPAIGVQVSVSNHGCAASASTHVALREDGVESARWVLGPIAAGATGVLGIQPAFTHPGCHLLEFVVDPDSIPGVDSDPARDALPVEACLGLCTLPPDANLNYRVSNCDLSVSNPRPQAGESVQFIARVSNSGFTGAVEPVAVRFSIDSIRWGPEVLVGPLGPGQMVEVSSAPWPVDFTPRELQVVVDPSNAQPETNELDNRAVGFLPYDLQLAPLAACPPSNPATFSACSPCPNTPVGIRALVFNTGLLAADSVAVEFREIGAVDSVLGTLVATGPNLIDGCAGFTIPAGAIPVEVVHAFPLEGTHHIQITADPAARWPEFSETNNRRTQNLTVLCGDRPDLTVEVSWPPELVVPSGETIPSTPLTVHNIGSGDANDVHLRVRLDGTPLCDDLVLTRVPAFSSASVSCDVPWVVTPEVCSLRLEVCVDPENRIPESNETNNCSTAAAPRGSCDLRPFSLSLSPSQPDPFQAVNINLQVLDVLEHGAAASVLVFTFGDQAQFIGGASLVASPYGFATVPWVFDPQVYFLQVVVTGACPRDINPYNDSVIFSVNGSPPGTPVAVTDLVATSMEDGVRLSWRAAADLDAFAVERRDNGAGDWRRLAVEPQRMGSFGESVEWRVLDSTVPAGAHSEYRVLSTAADGSVEVAGTVLVEHTRGRTTPWLESSRPHPFRPGGVVVLYLPRAADAQLTIYDAAGRRVATPWHGAMGAGRHEIAWDATDGGGRRLPAGVYFAELRAEGASRVRRLVLVH